MNALSGCATPLLSAKNRSKRTSGRYLKNASDAEDVWKRGYGNGNQIAWLFLALVRAAGIAADPVIVSTRDVHFFNPNVMNPNDLNSNIVVVTLDGKDLFLDPGTALAPFGTLPWCGNRSLRIAAHQGRRRLGHYAEARIPRTRARSEKHSSS